MQAGFGEGASINAVEIAFAGIVPLRDHPHEQLAIVLRGMQILRAADREYELDVMDAQVIPSGVLHSRIGGPEWCLVLDIFVPTREN